MSRRMAGTVDAELGVPMPEEEAPRRRSKEKRE